jgi:hypothetical protein
LKWPNLSAPQRRLWLLRPNRPNCRYANRLSSLQVPSALVLITSQIDCVFCVRLLRRKPFVSCVLRWFTKRCRFGSVQSVPTAAGDSGDHHSQVPCAPNQSSCSAPNAAAAAAAILIPSPLVACPFIPLSPLPPYLHSDARSRRVLVCIKLPTIAHVFYSITFVSLTFASSAVNGASCFHHLQATTALRAIASASVCGRARRDRYRARDLDRPRSRSRAGGLRHSRTRACARTRARGYRYRYRYRCACVRSSSSSRRQRFDSTTTVLPVLAKVLALVLALARI